MSKKITILLSLLMVVVSSSFLHAANLTISTNAKVDTLTINSGSTVAQTGSSLSVAGDFTNNGTFTANSNTVVLTGSEQTLSGDITFYNLTIQSSGLVTKANADKLTISGKLEMATSSGVEIQNVQ